jgi:hypothetical protein
MFPRVKDEVRENAEIVHRILQGQHSVRRTHCSVWTSVFSNIALSSKAFLAANPA